ncbi:oxysterol-binding protein-related protein 1C-like isoform X2 [Castanea sativa]|uniref:oxysterol-binding protein-related protein 1C-like isoform X2 n=1 Tax=Castanea sativa TaxID=21020 RepID=UPI003F64FD03
MGSPEYCTSGCKGWRPRWFVLQDDGVLTYYKIHGPDKIVVNQGTEKGSKVIGEESLRRISKHRNGASLPQQNLPRKPFGEIHLKMNKQQFSKNFSGISNPNINPTVL